MSVKHFRSALNGFNRQDVVQYIEYLNNQHNAKVEQLNNQLQAALAQPTDEELKDLLDSDQDWIDEFKDEQEIVDDPDWLDDPDLDLDKLRNELKEYIKKQKPAKLKPIKTKMKKMVTNAPKNMKDRVNEVERVIGGSDNWLHWVGFYDQLPNPLNKKTIYFIKAGVDY
jgi:hypothetical protein